MKHISPIQPLTDRISIVTDPWNLGALYRSDDGYLPKKILDRQSKHALRWVAKVLAKQRVDEQSNDLRVLINGGKP